MKCFILLALATISCRPNLTPDELINASIQAHGLDNLTGKQIEFDFRDKHYTLLRELTEYTYTRSFQDSSGMIQDVLINSQGFFRTVNGDTAGLSKDRASKYLNSVNSVLYFVQLPLPLNDAAAIKTYQKDQEINGKEYHQVEVRFSQEGGGKDFEDIFLYWFQQETYTLDYFAYSYLTDGGGLRFREAINRRTINGIVFQDYINYKPKSNESGLYDLPDLFKKGKLTELSRIENTNIQVIEVGI